MLDEKYHIWNSNTSNKTNGGKEYESFGNLFLFGGMFIVKVFAQCFTA